MNARPTEFKTYFYDAPPRGDWRARIEADIRAWAVWNDQHKPLPAGERWRPENFRVYVAYPQDGRRVTERIDLQW